MAGLIYWFFFKVEEFFQDFDPLRHGSISRPQFRRCLSLMGQPNLTDEQFEVLAQYYKDPKLPSNVKWTGFLTDTEMGEYWIQLRLCVLALGHSCDVYSLLGKFKDLVLFLSTLAATKLYFTAQFKHPSPPAFSSFTSATMYPSSRISYSTKYFLRIFLILLFSILSYLPPPTQPCSLYKAWTGEDSHIHSACYGDISNE